MSNKHLTGAINDTEDAKLFWRNSPMIVGSSAVVIALMLSAYFLFGVKG